jgi:N-methylhydantoinase B
LDGGLCGAPARYLIEPDSQRERDAAPEFGSKAFDVPLAAGSVISQWTAGGGGWGNPAERDPVAVAHDVEQSYVSREAAHEIYRVVLKADGQVDEGATALLRAQLKLRGQVREAAS